MKKKLPKQEEKEYKQELESLKSKTKVKQKKANKPSRPPEADDSDIDMDELRALELQREPKAKKATKTAPKLEKKATKLKKKAKVSKEERKRQKEYVLALAEEPEKKRISKTSSKKLKSIVGDSAEQIQQLLEINEGDSARSLIYKKVLQSLIDLIPYAENNIRKSKGRHGVYQLNSMISSIRELLIDIQASEDRGRIGELLVERLIAPAMLDIGTEIVQRLDYIKSDAKDEMTPEGHRRFADKLSKHRGELAEVINSKFYSLRDEIKQQLQR